MNTLLLPKQIELNTEEIIYLESDSNYTYIFSKDAPKNMLVALSLCKLQASLCHADFVRINRGNLINMRYVKKYEVGKESVTLTLKNGKKLRSSRRRTEALLNHLKKAF